MLDYRELLQRTEWQEKRGLILKRDGYSCIQCGKKDGILDVHHCRYIVGRMPWDYSDSALVTLCRACHRSVHFLGKIKVLNRHGYRISKLPKCDRCSGLGYFGIFEHVEHGICFKCYGSTIDFGKLEVSPDETIAKRSLLG